MPRPKYSNPRLRRFTKRKPGSWYNFYKARSPKTSINPDKFKRIVTLLGASDYSLSEISRMTNTDNSTLSNINSVLKLRTKKEADVIRKIAARAAKVIPEAELKRRENAILTALRHRKEITKDLITFLVRRKRISLEKVVERVRQMEEAGVPFIGLMNKLGASQPKFDGIVARYYNSGLTERQREVHAYLLRRKVSKKIARKVAGTHLEIADLQRKFDFFASFKLDPAIYGVERIPLKMYEHMLLDQLATIKKGIKKKIIYTLEDAQARIELDKLLTGWRKSRALTTKKAGSVIRPANLLRRARALIAAGKKVSVVALTSYSAKTISQGTGANVVSIAESKRRTPIQQRIVFPEDQISKLLDKGIEVGEIAKKTGLPLADVKRLRRIRIIVFEHLQKAGAWMVITRAKGGIAARRAFTSDSLHKTFKTREDWETAIRMANMERNIKPHTIVLALTSLGTAIKKQRGFVPASPEPERHTAVEKPSAKKKTNAPKPLSTFDQSLSTSKRRKRAINLILNSNSPEAVKQRMLARVAKYEQEHPQKRTAIK